MSAKQDYLTGWRIARLLRVVIDWDELDPHERMDFTDDEVMASEFAEQELDRIQWPMSHYVFAARDSYAMRCQSDPLSRFRAIYKLEQMRKGIRC